MTEARTERLLPWAAFRRRLLRSAGIAFTLLFLSLLIGTTGFRLFAGLGWLDSFVNAAMLLGGMGLVISTTTTAGKLFASAFALYAGLAFFGMAALLFAPMFHRMLHRFHLEDLDRS